VRGPGCEAKVWVDPRVRVDRTHGFDPRALNRLRRIVAERADEIREAWRDHFGD